MGMGKIPGGSGRALRLDPFTLPVRFAAEDAAADGGTRHIELYRERVVLRRFVRGMRVALNLPLTTYLGLAIRKSDDGAKVGAQVAIVLEHRDPALSVPLFVSANPRSVVGLSQTWARVLELPILGNEPQQLQTALSFGNAISRRHGRGTLRQRRPSILLRRKPGRTSKELVIHREDEIIARD